MRTITQRTTLPFLIAESGAASLTLAVMTSPRPARRPRSPPRGRMQERRRAPELSATSRIVRIPIIRNLPTCLLGKRKACPPNQTSPCPTQSHPHQITCTGGAGVFACRILCLHIQFRRRHTHLCRTPHDAVQPPPLQL